MLAAGLLACALLPSPARGADAPRIPKRTLFAPPPKPAIPEDAPTATPALAPAIAPAIVPAAAPVAAPAPLAPSAIANPTPPAAPLKSPPANSPAPTAAPPASLAPVPASAPLTPAPAAVPIAPPPPLDSIPPLSPAPAISTAPAAARQPLAPPPPEPVAPLPATFAPLPALTPPPAPDEPILPEKVVPVPQAAVPANLRSAPALPKPSAPSAPLTLAARATPAPAPAPTPAPAARPSAPPAASPVPPVAATPRGSPAPAPGDHTNPAAPPVPPAPKNPAPAAASVPVKAAPASVDHGIAPAASPLVAAADTHGKPAAPAAPSVAPSASAAPPAAAPDNPFAQSPGHPTTTVPDDYDFKIKSAIDSNNVPFHLEALVKSSTNLVSHANALRQSLKQRQLAEFQTQLELARQCRREKNFPRAITLLIELVEGDAPPGFKRPALYEMALAHHEDRQLVRAQQIFAQYLKLYDNDPMTPEVFLRQGMIFREMGVANLAIGKFYAVMSSALNLQQDKIDYYKTLVLHAQTEIADTYFQLANFTQAADFYQRLLKLTGTELNRPQIHFKLIRSLAQLDRHLEAIGQGKALVSRHPDAPEVPETRYQIAMSLKALNRNNEALQEVLALLQTQQSVAAKDPANWAYWQQRTGNEIANHFYKENDNLNALVIYQNLAQISPAAAWQLPAWYQTALVYERLRQPEKALETYARILARTAEADPKANPGLAAVVDMARWRKEYLTWHGVADTRSAALRAPALVVRPLPTDPISVATLAPADALVAPAAPTFTPIGSPGIAPAPAPSPAPVPQNNPPAVPQK